MKFQPHAIGVQLREDLVGFRRNQPMLLDPDGEIQILSPAEKRPANHFKCLIDLCFTSAPDAEIVVGELQDATLAK